VVTGWLAPLLLLLAIVLQARTFYVIYVRKVRTRSTVIIAWISLTFMVVFWTWYLALGGKARIQELFQPEPAETEVIHVGAPGPWYRPLLLGPGAVGMWNASRFGTGQAVGQGCHAQRHTLNHAARGWHDPAAQAYLTGLTEQGLRGPVRASGCRVG
jgi:hypothetical protein